MGDLTDHQVVAYPQETSAARGRLRSLDPSQRPQQQRPRSLSAGRSRIRNTDIVQEVYDRLGVRRGGDWGTTTSDADAAAAAIDSNLETPAEEVTRGGVEPSEGPKPLLSPSRRDEEGSKFRERFRASATRGRERQTATSPADERRSRSLSRGRLAHRWPPRLYQPEQLQSEIEVETSKADSTDVTSSPMRSRGNNNTTTPTSNTYASSPRPQYSPPRGSAVSHHVMGSLPSLSKSYSLGAPTTTSPDVLVVEGKTSDWRDEKKEPETAPGCKHAEEHVVDEPPAVELSAVTTKKSIRERMIAYSGGSSVTKKKKPTCKNYTVDKQYAAQFAVREHPPKVDIYGEKLGGDEKKEEDDTSLPEGTTTTQQPQRDDVALRKTKSTSSSRSMSPETRGAAATNSKGHRSVKSTGGNTVTSIVSAINQQKSKIVSPKNPSPRKISGNSKLSPTPMVEIAAGSENTPGNDTNSVSMSSVSAEDVSQGYRSPAGDTSKKPLWLERNRLRSQNFASAVQPHQTTSPTQQPQKASFPDDISRAIDDRVRAHVSDMETRLVAQMRRWMQQMDDKILMRVEAMEDKLNDLQASVDALHASSR